MVASSVGGKKNGGGYFKGKSYCRRKSSMQSQRRVLLENYRSNLRLARRRGGVAGRLVSRRARRDTVAFHIGATSNSRRRSAYRGKKITCGAKRTRRTTRPSLARLGPRRGRTKRSPPEDQGQQDIPLAWKGASGRRFIPTRILPIRGWKRRAPCASSLHPHRPIPPARKPRRRVSSSLED